MSGRIVAFGEVMARLSPAAGEVLGQSTTLSTWFGGAEANAMATVAQLGGKAALITTLPANALGLGARAALAARGIETRFVAMSDRGRLGLYFATYGAGVQPPEVLYDRAGSAFAVAPQNPLTDAALEGAAFLHITGITPAVSQDAASASLDIARRAVAAGVKVSFDGNYRAKLWAAWGGNGPSILQELLGLATVAFVDHRDIALILGEDFASIDIPARNEAAYNRAFDRFPNLQLICATQRVVHHMTHHEIGACALARGGEMIRLAPVSVANIIDRIGGGDAFAGAMLHGLSLAMPIEAALKRALAACVAKHAQRGDMLSITPEALQVSLDGASDIQR
jgi:2-dehydro-3-deoxygluconokinase